MKADIDSSPLNLRRDAGLCRAGVITPSGEGCGIEMDENLGDNSITCTAPAAVSASTFDKTVGDTSIRLVLAAGDILGVRRLLLIGPAL